MKNKFLLLILFLHLFGCASVTGDLQKINPNEYGLDDSFNNRIFFMFCSGNRWANNLYRTQACIKTTAEFVNTRGFSYFSIITKYENNYVFVLINSKELEAYKKNFHNYYRVADYLYS